MHRLFAFFVALSLFLIIPAAPAHATAPSRKAASQRGPTPSDAQIEATIRTKLAKSKIGKDGFRFRVQHGVVTWEGNTNVMQHKGSATRMARTAGAVQVINNIQVSASAKAKASAQLKKASVVQPQ
ncbi:MAG: BON domain-containing protein [Acidobacteriaceae bacterium]|nr:BON domain-containing protein [Acidobacteriaceae bacterium]MBV9779143.1 BON domain-containing protein [Acidobacteriaceae bacterium]